MKKILIVEDEKEYREILAKRLKREGFFIVTANNGKEGLDYLMKNDADLIILDLMMPLIDGNMFIKHLRDSLLKKTPVVVLTNLESSVFDTGIVDFLPKASFSLDQIVEKIKGYLPKGDS